ncbi:MAG: hypothetical protein IJ309_05860 [Clostridia bacterium]|nr:hypothetical protein [Clostridia bacterium]
MFTRYNNGINIPSNYGGSRFRVPPETETKTHRETEFKPISSPSAITTKISEPEQNDYISDFQKPDLDESIDTGVDENDAPADYSEPQEAKEQNQIKLLRDSFSSIFSHIEKDDLLLVALIILVASSSEGIDFGTTLILALLLIYH